MQTQLVILSFIAVLQVAIFLLLMRKRIQHPMEGVTSAAQRRAIQKMHVVVGKLTSINWNVNMVLCKDCGRVNLSQLEFLHQVSEAGAQAVTKIESALHDFDSEITSSSLSHTD